VYGGNSYLFISVMYTSAAVLRAGKLMSAGFSGWIMVEPITLSRSGIETLNPNN